MAKHAVLISGPIGAGKSTLGRSLAEAIGGGFIEGDDYSAPDKPWYSSILSTSRGIFGAACAILESRDFVVVAYPLARRNWVFYHRKFADIGVRTIVVSLRGSQDRLTSPGRGRIYSDEEIARMAEMIRQGYGGRPFSDLIIDTDRAAFSETVELLTTEVRRLACH